MGVYCTLHCEAYMNDRWTNIDLYHKNAENEFELIPVMEGKSVVYSALNWYGLLSHIEPTSNISDGTKAAHPTNYPDVQEWYTFDYRAFYADKDFSVPEYSGYFPKDSVNAYKAEGDVGILITADMCDEAIAPSVFAKLTPEAQQGYAYVEFTEPYSQHDIMRKIQQNVSQYLRPYPDFTGKIRIAVHVG